METDTESVDMSFWHVEASPFLIDITATITREMPLWDSNIGVGCFARVLNKDMDKGDQSYASYIGISAHTGTHIDMPSHFIPEEYKSGNTVETVDLGLLMGPVIVMEVPPGSNITAEVIRDLAIPADAEKLIFKTDSTTKDLMHVTPFQKSFTGMTPDGAAYMLEHYPSIRTIGIDYLSIATYETCAETHVALFKKHTMVIEGLLLQDVQPGWYTLTCLPLKIAGSEGAPARCILTNPSDGYSM